MTDVCIQRLFDVCVINLMHRIIIVSHSLTTPHNVEVSGTITKMQKAIAIRSSKCNVYILVEKS